VTSRPWPLTWRAWWLSVMRVFVLLLFTKFEVHRPSSSKHNDAFSVSALIGLMTLTFHLWPCNCCALWNFRSATFVLIVVFLGFSFSTYRPKPIRRSTWHCDRDRVVWPWKKPAWRWSWSIVLHLRTKFGWYDALSVAALIGLVTLTFDLLTSKLVHWFTCHGLYGSTSCYISHWP